jgi:hypothetical protein
MAKRYRQLNFKSWLIDIGSEQNLLAPTPNAKALNWRAQ